MTETPASSLDERVDGVIAEYLEAERAGQAPSPEELLARHPDLADELRSFFSDRSYLARFTPPVGPRSNPVNKRPGAPAPTVDAGRYVGLEPHARGGLGEVFSALDTELHRRVALKRLQDRRADDAASQRRFLMEAEVTARLEHPGIVPIHSLYRDDEGRPCYTMRFIEGETLAGALQEYHAGPPDPVAFRRLLQSFIQVCETVAYAHSRGVIHRDLKPQNIMLGKFGETLVVDWGLAKIVGRGPDELADNPETTLRPVGDSDSDRTQMGSAVGTPAYMSPEQAAGRWDVIGPASDVYNLGAVLYTLLTGRPPLDGSNWPELQQKIQRGDFPRPRTVKPAVPWALEAVCLKAMAVKPEDRYPSARGLASEIELWQADEPVEVYPEPVTQRLWRWTRRNRGLVGTGVSACVALVTVVVGTWIVSLERQIAAVERGGRVQLSMSHEGLERAKLQPRFDRFENSVRANLDQMAAQLGPDPRLDRPELQTLRKELLLQLLTFWEEAIRIDTELGGRPGGWRSHSYHLQLALCRARLGEHQRAAEVASSLESAARSKDSSGQAELDPAKAYDLARVYALCAAVTKNNGGMVEQYGDRAMKHLRTAATAGYFKEVARARRLREDRDLDCLRPREDFGKLLREVEPKLK